MLSALYKTHFKKNINLAVPVMLSQLGHVMVGVADSIMVGQLGAVPLAAVSLGNSIFAIILMFGIGMSMSATPLVAAADGENNYRKSAKVFKHGLYINIVTGVLLFLLAFAGAPVLFYLNQPEAVAAMTVPYLRIIAMSLIPFMVFQSFKQFAEGLSFTKNAMYITIAANLLNVGLNYAMIYGKFGFEPMGLIGAGWATFISRVLMAIAMAIYVIKNTKYAHYLKGFRIRGFSKKLAIRMVKLGFPTGMQFVFEVGAFSSAAIMIGWLGAQQLAAHQIAINLASISYMMATGIAAAATVRVGNQLGKNDIPNLRIAGFTSFIMGIGFMTITCLIFILGKSFFPGLYIKDDEVITIASSLLVIAAFFQISDGIQVVGLGALRGLEDVTVPTVIAVIAYWIIGLPVGYFLCFELGLGTRGIWFGLLIGLSLAAVMLSYRFNMLTKKLL